MAFRHTPRTAAENPRELPAYSIPEAAHYLTIPVATLRSWVRGRFYPTSSGQRRFEPLIELPDPKLSSLSFVNLVEAHILDAIRREHRVPLPRVRDALDYVRRQFGWSHPLAEQRFETDGLHLFVSLFFADPTCAPPTLISASESGQMAMVEMLKAHLRRVEHDASGRAVRLYPFTRKRASEEPKFVVIDPFVSFGRPSIAGTGVPTAIIAERYKAGESMDELAEDYGCQRPQVEEAVRCELELAA